MKKLLFILLLLPAVAFAQRDTVVKNQGTPGKNHKHDWKVRDMSQRPNLPVNKDRPVLIRICASCHRIESVHEKETKVQARQQARKVIDTSKLDDFGKAYYQYKLSKEQDEKVTTPAIR